MLPNVFNYSNKRRNLNLIIKQNMQITHVKGIRDMQSRIVEIRWISTSPCVPNSRNIG